ncbi:30S ribosomal protein S5 [Pseudomonadota bacterium]
MITGTIFLMWLGELLSEYEEKIIQVNRVSKKTKGGNKIGFSVLVVVGDKKGKVGVGLGKGPDVLSSIQKASRRAKKHLITVPLKQGTIPFAVTVKQGAAQVLLKPAPPGTGVIAGGAVRAVVEAAGVNNIVSKILGSSNQASNVYATFAALSKIRRIADIKGIKLSSEPQPTKPTNVANLKPITANPPKSTPKPPKPTTIKPTK